MKYDVKLSWDVEAKVWCTAVDTVGVYLCHESLPHLLSWTRDAVNDMLSDELFDDLRFIPDDKLLVATAL
jgi:hypothetical protein